MAKILAFDLGTTYFKITLFDRSGRLCDSCRIAPPIRSGQTGEMELPADAFREALAQGVRELQDRADGGLADVEAVTFATQTNSFVLLDAGDQPLTPIILWPDRRAAELEAEVRKRCGMPAFSATTGIPQMSAGFMVAKLLWLQRQAPEIWSRTRKVALISDYFTLLLTGQHVTEAGAAGLTGLVDIHRCRWWPEMLAQFELDESCLPRVVRAGTDLGPLDPRAAGQLGLPETCRFVVGCLDQYAGAIGAGNIEPGMVSETTGTVLATVQCADQIRHATRPGRVSGTGLSRRALLADGLRRRLGQLPPVVSRPTAGSARLRSTHRPGRTNRAGRRRVEAENRCRAHRAREGVCGHDAPTWAGPCGAVHHGGRGRRPGRADGNALPGPAATRDSLRRRRGSKRFVAANQGRRAGRGHRGDTNVPSPPALARPSWPRRRWAEGTCARSLGNGCA